MKVALSPVGETLLESLIVEDMVPKQYGADSHRRFPEYLEAMKKADLSKSRYEISEQLLLAIPDLTTRRFLLTNLLGGRYSYRWRMNLETIGKHLNSVDDVDLPKKTFHGKTLFISGGRSPYVTPEDHPLILSLFPKTQFAVVDSAGHWVHAEKPYDFIDHVARFIGGQ